MLEHATVDEADLLMFLLCTGVREAEAASACWTDIDLDAKVHKVTEHLNLDYIPKDKEEGNVQLPDVLIERLRARRAWMPHSRLIFPKGNGMSNGHLLRIIKQLGLRAGANCGHCVNKRGLSCANHPVCSRWIRRCCLNDQAERRLEARTRSGLTWHRSCIYSEVHTVNVYGHRSRTKSATLTGPHERFSAAPMRLSRMYWSNSLGKTRRSRRPTRF